MPTGPQEPDGGIRWQTEDAADALLSDIMSEVSQDAVAEKEALEAERLARDEEDRRQREEAERRQNTEIEQRLKEEEARRAAAEEERRKLMREAEIAKAVARGEIDEDEARRLSAPEPTEDELDQTVDATAAAFDRTASEATMDQVTAPHAQSPVIAPQHTVIHAKAPPPETKWGITIALVIPLLLAAAALTFLLIKEKDMRTHTEEKLAKSRTEAAGLQTKLAAADKRLSEEKGRYRKLQDQLDSALTSAKTSEAKAAPAKSGKPAAAKPRSRARSDSGGGKPDSDSGSDKKSKKKKGKGRNFDLGESIFEGGKDGKIVF